jgi:hypothetical protein|tara:strand:+ start:1111 stop:1908 length:798 start_codon:yes stop_codon:yes gene_type:complete
MQIDLIVNKLSQLTGGSFIVEYKNINDVETIKQDIFNTMYSKQYEKDLNFFELSPEKDSSVITVGQIRELKKRFLHKAVEKTPIVIFNRSIGSLNNNSANALLKITEETPANTFFIFFTDSAFKVLSTIKSRSRIIRIDNKKSSISLKDYIFDLKIKNQNIPENIFDQLSEPFFKKNIIQEGLFFDCLKIFDKHSYTTVTNLYLKIIQYFLYSSIKNDVLFKYLLKLHSDFLYDINESTQFNTMTSDLLAVYFYRLQSNVVKYGG